MIKGFTMHDPVIYGLNSGPPDLERGLVGRWEFEETGGSNSVDATGRGNDFTVGGGVAADPGIIGNALHLNGSVQAAANSSADLTGTGSMSVVVWLKIHDDAFLMPVLGKDAEYTLVANPGVGFQWRLFHAGGSASTTLNYSFDLTLNEWCMAVMIYDRAKRQIRMSVNGADYESITGPAGLNTTSAQLILGKLSVDYFYGDYDQMRFYRRALSQSEVALLWNGGAGV